MRFSDQLSLFDLPERAGCLRSELGTCLAPCLADSLKSDYRQQEDMARAWMRGETAGLDHELILQMQTAIQRTQFERAARLKEDAAIMKWLHGKLKQLQKASCNPPSIYWVETSGGGRFPKNGILYLLRSGGVQYAIAYRKQNQPLRESLERWWAADRELELKYCRTHESLGLVATWFQKNPSLRKNCFQVKSLEEAMEKLSHRPFEV